MQTIQPILRCVADRLQFRYPFRIAHGERTGTDVVLVNPSAHGCFGFGEAPFPPYLPLMFHDVLTLLHPFHVGVELEWGDPGWGWRNSQGHRFVVVGTYSLCQLPGGWLPSPVSRC